MYTPLTYVWLSRHAQIFAIMHLYTHKTHLLSHSIYGRLHISTFRYTYIHLLHISIHKFTLRCVQLCIRTHTKNTYYLALYTDVYIYLHLHTHTYILCIYLFITSRIDMCNYASMHTLFNISLYVRMYTYIYIDIHIYASFTYIYL